MLREERFSIPTRAEEMPLIRSSSSRALCTLLIARIAHRQNAGELETLLLLNDVLQFLRAWSEDCRGSAKHGTGIRINPTENVGVRIGNALSPLSKSSFLGQLAMELTVLNLIAPLVHRFAR